MAPVRFARAFLLPVFTATAAFALSGCMQTVAPVARAPAGDLDSMAYGPPAKAPAPVADASGGGAITALRNAMAGSRYSSAPAPVVMSASQPAAYGSYAAAPIPVRYDAGYRLDAGDKLRVVV